MLFNSIRFTIAALAVLLYNHLSYAYAYHEYMLEGTPTFVWGETVGNPKVCLVVVGIRTKGGLEEKACMIVNKQLAGEISRFICRLENAPPENVQVDVAISGSSAIGDMNRKMIEWRLTPFSRLLHNGRYYKTAKSKLATIVNDLLRGKSRHISILCIVDQGDTKWISEITYKGRKHCIIPTQYLADLPEK